MQMIAAVIVAAGKGLRMGGAEPKQFLRLGPHPIVADTLKRFDESGKMDRIVLVAPRDAEDYCRREVVDAVRPNTPVDIVAGGRRRQDSVHCGLSAMETSDALVLIHDGVRPLVTVDLIEACIQGARQWGACVPAVPVIDTLKKTDPRGRILQTIDRSSLYAVQTPQAFKLSVIRQAHDAARINGLEGTDDASLVEAIGRPVHIIPGERTNIKLTTPEDMVLARAYQQALARAAAS